MWIKFPKMLIAVLCLIAANLSSVFAKESLMNQAKSRLLTIEISASEVILFFHNEETKDINVLDTLMLADSTLPPILLFKVINLSEVTPENFYALEASSEWLFPPKYKEYAFAVSKKPIILAPNSYLKKSWNIADILGIYAACEEEVCRFLIKFQAKAYPGSDIANPLTKETPWTVFTVEN